MSNYLFKEREPFLGLPIVDIFYTLIKNMMSKSTKSRYYNKKKKRY